MNLLLRSCGLLATLLFANLVHADGPALVRAYCVECHGAKDAEKRLNRMRKAIRSEK